MHLYLIGTKCWYQVLVRLPSVTNSLLVNAIKMASIDSGKKNPEKNLALQVGVWEWG